MTKSPFKKEGSFHQETGFTFKEENSKVLHLEHRFDAEI
jgi:hypothetical protein